MEVQSEISESMQVRIYNYVKAVDSDEHREMKRKLALLEKEHKLLQEYMLKREIYEIEIEKDNAKAKLVFQGRYTTGLELPPEVREQYSVQKTIYVQLATYDNGEDNKNGKQKLKLKLK